MSMSEKLMSKTDPDISAAALSMAVQIPGFFLLTGWDRDALLAVLRREIVQRRGLPAWCKAR